MEKNWYAVYTKPQAEKKVAALFSKKKIECFVPMIYAKAESMIGHKLIYEPLFKSIVFVYTDAKEASLLKHTTGVINLLYWLGKPAIIAKEEIAVINEFTSKGYKNIKLEPVNVKKEKARQAQNGAYLSIEGRLYTLKNKMVKIDLPSLGYALIAEIDEESIFHKDLPLEQNNRLSFS